MQQHRDTAPSGPTWEFGPLFDKTMQRPCRPARRCTALQQQNVATTENFVTVVCRWEPQG